MPELAPNLVRLDSRWTFVQLDARSEQSLDQLVHGACQYGVSLAQAQAVAR